MEDFNRNPNEYQPTDNSAAENITAETGASQTGAPQTGANPFGSQQSEFYSEGAYLSPVYVTKKKGVNPLAIILPIAAAVIAAVAVFIVLMLNKPASYREAEKKFFGSLFTAAEQTETLVNDSLSSEKLTVDFSTPLGDLSGIDLSQYRLEIDTAGGEDASYALVKAILGQETDLTAEMWIDRAGGKSYIFFPDISDIYAVIDANKAAQNTGDYSRYSESLNRVIEKTSEVYFEVIGDPVTEKNAQFTVNGNTYTADKAVIHLDLSQMAVICKAFVENLIENADTADMICQIGSYDTLEEMREEAGELIDQMQDVIDGRENDAEGAFDMTVYMNNDTIIGREIVITDYNNEEKIFIDLYQISSNDGETGYFRFGEGSANSYDMSELAFSYDDRTSGGVHNGTVDFSVSFGSDAVSLKADYTDLSAEEESFGGVIDVTLGGVNNLLLSSETEGQSDTYSAKVNLSKDGEKKIVSLTVPNICTVNFTSEPSDIGFKAVPSPAPDKAAVINDESDENYEILERLLEDFSDYLFPDYGGYDEPDIDFPEINEPSEGTRDVYESAVLGSWRPVRMIAFDEEYDLNDEEFADMIEVVYTFSADGVLTAANEAEDFTESHTYYFDGSLENHILLDDDIYTSIYYDEASDMISVGDDSGLIVIWFERI